MQKRLTKEQDRTGQSANRRKAKAKLNKRLRMAERDVKQLVRDLPVSKSRESQPRINDVTVYDYDVDEFYLQQLENDIYSILAFWLLMDNDQSKPQNFYFDENMEQAYRGGTLETLRDFTQELVAAAIAGALAGGLLAPTPEQTLFSQGYLRSLANYLQRGYSQIKSLTGKTKDDVFQVISGGILGKQSPQEIIKTITKRFKVARSNAARIVNAEISRAFNFAILDMGDSLAKQGYPVAVQHLSALLDTTRPTHAERHLKFFTLKAQREWWQEGSNLINCYCSVVLKLLDKKGKPINPIK